MPTQVRSKKQARSDRRALKILHKAGLIKKPNLRAKPTPNQKRQIRKFDAVIKGRAAVVTPADPKSYRELFQVIGKRVIVPRHKGERVKVGKRGAIISERKIGKGKRMRIVRSRYKRVKSNADLSDQKATMFFVPFIRGRDKNGKPILEWKRFPTKQLLIDIMGGYESKEKNPYTNWQNYVIEERIDPAHLYTMTKDLAKRLDRKLGSGKRSRIKFDDDGGDDE